MTEGHQAEGTLTDIALEIGHVVVQDRHSLLYSPKVVFAFCKIVNLTNRTILSLRGKCGYTDDDGCQEKSDSHFHSSFLDGYGNGECRPFS